MAARLEVFQEIKAEEEERRRKLIEVELEKVGVCVGAVCARVRVSGDARPQTVLMLLIV
jgi:hypothetical protein